MVNGRGNSILNGADSRSWLLDELAARTGGIPQLYRAPGRVNIIGEHTDYTGGFVLPTTTAVYTWIAASPRTDRTITVKSLNLDDEHSFDLDDIKRSEKPEWFDYIKGVAALLQLSNIRLQGADFVIDSDIPIGGGLSSSAALEVVFATGFLDIANASMSKAEISQLCQRAEIEYAGVNCGVMDQFAITSCKHGNAVLLDCRSLEAKHVRLPDSICFLITDSGVKHKLPEGEYNQRTEECAIATKLLAEKFSELKALRDLDSRDLEGCRTLLGDTLYRRCRHVVSENQRVLDACTALQCADATKLGELISESHTSLKHDFEVSCDEVDSLVNIADSCDGVLGSRMIGAGFGGCVLSVTEKDKIESAISQISKDYEKVTGCEPWMHIVTATDAAKKIGVA